MRFEMALKIFIACSKSVVLIDFSCNFITCLQGWRKTGATELRRKAYSTYKMIIVAKMVAP